MADLTWQAVEAFAVLRQEERIAQFDLDSIREYIFRLSYALTLDYTLAEDLAQDCVIKVWQHRQRLQCLDNPEAWIAKVVTNRARTYWKRRPNWLPLPTTIVQPGEQDPTVIELRGFVSQLKSEFRDVILLVSIYGFTYPEVAEILGVPEGTVSSRLNHAKKELRKRMTP